MESKEIDLSLSKISNFALRKVMIKAIEEKSVIVVSKLLANSNYFRQKEMGFLRIALEKYSRDPRDLQIIELLTQHSVSSDWHDSLLYLAITKDCTEWVEKLLQG